MFIYLLIHQIYILNFVNCLDLGLSVSVAGSNMIKCLLERVHSCNGEVRRLIYYQVEGRMLYSQLVDDMGAVSRGYLLPWVPEGRSGQG